jgi:hypothetical protein
MDTNIIVAISVSSFAVCLCCACLVGECFARKRREKDRQEFCASVTVVDTPAVVCST